MDSKRRTGKAPAGAPGEISEREYWQQEKEKAIWDLMIFFAAVVIVAIAVGTAAWFASNKEVGGNGMHVLAEVPEQVQISGGKTTDKTLNDSEDVLVLSDGVVQEPRETGADSRNDWSNQFQVANYYRFGRLIPASSDSGKHILFTPDAAGNGKKLKTNARFFVADQKTDGDLKALSGVARTQSDANADTDSLMATAYAFPDSAAKSVEDFWTGYSSSTIWFNTNDDGYYVDIPLWLRTNARTPVSLYVEGYVTKKDGSLATEEGDPDALYKAVRVALLKEQNSGLIPAVTADTEGKAKNIIPLQNATAYGMSDNSILDSKNYTVTRDKTDEITDGKLYGLGLSDALYTNGGILQAGNYTEYMAYTGETVVTLATPEEEAEWGEKQKLILRIWLDGEDKDCWNETAGQDWSIHLKFVRAEEEDDNGENP